jgi:hypothetical protein
MIHRKNKGYGFAIGAPWMQRLFLWHLTLAAGGDPPQRIWGSS